MDRGIQDLPIHAVTPHVLPAAPRPVIRIEPLVRSELNEHTLARRGPDTYEPGGPVPGPVSYGRFLDQQNREDRSAARRRDLCPVRDHWVCQAGAGRTRASNTPGQDRSVQNHQRPAAARIGDLAPIPLRGSPPPAILKASVAHRYHDPAWPGRVIDVLI